MSVWSEGDMSVLALFVCMYVYMSLRGGDRIKGRETVRADVCQSMP